MTTRVAVVTGGSSGIGAATVRRLRSDGFDVVAGARRMDRLHDVCDAVSATALALDVTDRRVWRRSARRFLAATCSSTTRAVRWASRRSRRATTTHWRTMWETNVFGMMLMTRALLPKLEASGNGHIVNIGSIAGIETYPGGGGYTSVKHAARAISHTLRLELVGKPVHVIEIDPGLVETEFSLVRFDGR